MLLTDSSEIPVFRSGEQGYLLIPFPVSKRPFPFSFIFHSLHDKDRLMELLILYRENHFSLASHLIEGFRNREPFSLEHRTFLSCIADRPDFSIGIGRESMHRLSIEEMIVPHRKELHSLDLDDVFRSDADGDAQVLQLGYDESIVRFFPIRMGNRMFTEDGMPVDLDDLGGMGIGSRKAECLPAPRMIIDIDMVPE